MSAQNLETLAKRYVELKSRIADLQEEADGLKAELMENREPGEYAAGPLTVKICKGKRNLDAGAFEKHFPIQQYADCYQVKPKALSAIVKKVGEYAAGPLTVKICKGKRNLDAGAFEKHFPIQQYADCYQVKPKALSAIVKKVGENALQDCVKVGAASLVVE